MRSWVILNVTALILTLLYIFAAPILASIGQTPEISSAAGVFSIYMIPQIFAYAVNFPTDKFLQSQSKIMFMAAISAAAHVLHVPLTWFVMEKLKWGMAGLAVVLNGSWWFIEVAQLVYIFSGTCGEAWPGFSWEAFHNLWGFVRLSLASADCCYALLSTGIFAPVWVRLTHEKAQCPLLKKGSHLARSPSTPQEPEGMIKEKYHAETPPAHRLLEAPSGFPSLFPEFSKDDRRSALMYVSHSDATERMARIVRVNHHIEDIRRKKDEDLPLFSTDLLKEKGMVFKYDITGDKLKSISTRCVSQSRSAPALPNSQGIALEESDQSSSSHLVTEISTGFHMGSSSKTLATGSLSGQKKPRNRPLGWKRRLRKLTTTSQNPTSVQDAASLEGGNKRKSNDAAIKESKK
ncbi:hypothetical protein F2Q69_00023745 [Brassica cretica]|uniref:DUF4220 domain-containing protein n=1 Tax=Brassica cretica TaxID=69181 RepID=A0A8S9QHU2_BRACR|nr:hypothetical protein F2Q69_00023745 [Brassica cretica]